MNWLTELRTISGFSNLIEITPITKGWSQETKLRIKLPSGERYLIRLAEKNQFESMKHNFNAIKQLSLSNLNISRPIDFGLTSSSNFCYSMFTWLEGNDAEAEIPKLSPSKQYDFGRIAGNMLREIHKYPAPTDVQEWGSKFSYKVESRIKSYQLMNIRLHHDQTILQFIHDNMKFLTNRSQSLQHGDFHLGNMVVNYSHGKSDKELGLIDFNRLSYGDPWEDFERCFFTIQRSIPFMNGQIHSYFNDNVPDLFFRLLALYVGYSCIASIPWAKQFGPEEIEKLKHMSNSVIKMFNNFHDYIPKWYEDP